MEQISPFKRLIASSLGKKYLMALTGFVLVGFVIAHMLGNIQIFLGPEAINTYASKLQNLPIAIKWGFRLFLLTAVAIHVWTAVLLTIENKQARPNNYADEKTVQASYASRTMPITGLIVLCFIIFHILHYTAQVIFDYKDLHYDLNGEHMHDVYSMMVLGFSHWWVSIFYIIAMGLLCMHLSHGISSMFQSMGWSNEKWRGVLKITAILIGAVLFIGFSSIPVAIMMGMIKPIIGH